MPVSVRELSRITGLSPTAVSQALRGKGRISPTTREKILAVASRLDYQANPQLSHAFARLREASDSPYRETLGLILEWPTNEGPAYQKLVHAAAEKEAIHLGFKLDDFIVGDKAAEQRKLSKVLRARGIRGLIILPRLAFQKSRLHFEWEHFAPIEIGRTLWQPRNLFKVETGGYQRLFEALHLLKKAGYQRIGMAVEPTHNYQLNGIFYSAFLHSQLKQPAKQRIPILAPNGPWNKKAFRQWITRYRPDVIFIHKVNTVTEWLDEMKLRVPEDISLFCTNAQEPKWSGLRRDYSGMGSAAVQMVSLLLQNNVLGLQPNPRCLQLDEFWQPGRTLSRSIQRFIAGSESHRIEPPPAEDAIARERVAAF